jgi:hypothetical protein
MRQRRIIVMGYMAACPIAGVIWQHLHYISGLQRLGHEVYYVEDSSRYPYNPTSFPDVTVSVATRMHADCIYAADTLRGLAETFGFQNRWVYSARFLDPPQSFGLEMPCLRELYREADAILNVCGSHELNEDLLKSGRLIYVESDPGVAQIQVDQSDEDLRTYLTHHQVLFTFGENIGSELFPVPLHGLRWLPTRQPIVTEFWKTKDGPAADAAFTTIANWSTRGQKDITWNGETYLWSKSENFLRFIDAPQVAGEKLEIATDIRDTPTARLFRSKGWRLRSPFELSVNRELYRRYVQGSRGEFTVSKENVVQLNTGWFSDRSACYLAAGRPVITQETGFTRHYGGEKGLFAFSDLDGVREASAAIRADYAMHSRAAYEIAREFFEAEKVLGSLLERAGI